MKIKRHGGEHFRYMLNLSSFLEQMYVGGPLMFNSLFVLIKLCDIVITELQLML